MLCKKCNTIIGSQDGVCKVCGHPARKGGRGWPRYAKIAAIFLVLGFSATFVFLFTQDRIDFSDFFNMGTETITNPEETPPVSADDDTENSLMQTGYEASSTPTLILRSPEETRHLLSQIHTAAVAFISQNPQTPFISQMGYLFDMANGRFMTPQVLMLAGLLGEEHLEDDKIILFLRPSDLGLTGPDMAVFVGHQTIVGIGLYGGLAHGYMEIFREDLNEILSSYIQSEGDISRPTAAHPVYQAVAGAIAAHKNAEIDVRFMAASPYFAFATTSVQGASHQLRHFVLDINNNFEIIAQNLENERHPTQAINKAAPNFNFNLLPPFNLNSTTLITAPPALLALEPQFVAATTAHAFLILPDGQAFLANFDANAQWILDPVANWQDAEISLLRNLHACPTYILKQQ